MKKVATAFMMAACWAWAASNSFAAPGIGNIGGGGGGGGGVGGGAGVHVDVGGRGDNNNNGGRDNFNSNDQGGVNAHVDHGNYDQGNNNNDRSKNNNNNSNNNNSNMNRAQRINRSEHLGDKDWDKHRIGGLDEARYKDRHDDNWRYRRWGDEWWYWVPQGYWMYYRGDRWTRYDDNYVDIYENGNNQRQNSNFNGPYYEDEKGFYYQQNGHRVYDPQIRRTNG